MFEIIGWTGGILLAICGFPQMIKSIRDGHSRGLEWSFIMMWYFGEIFSLVYIWPRENCPMIMNFSLTIMFITVIIYYKKFERE